MVQPGSNSISISRTTSMKANSEIYLVYEQVDRDTILCYYIDSSHIILDLSSSGA